MAWNALGQQAKHELLRVAKYHPGQMGDWQRLHSQADYRSDPAPCPIAGEVSRRSGSSKVCIYYTLLIGIYLYLCYVLIMLVSEKWTPSGKPRTKGCRSHKEMTALLSTYQKPGIREYEYSAA